MNQHDFDVPPMTDVPEDARARIEGRVLTDLGTERKSRMWLPATAAAVALLVSGTIAITHRPGQLPDSSNTQTVAQLPVDSDGVTAEVDRCWKSAQQLAKVAKYPDRSQWRPVLAVTGVRSTITAIATRDKPLFCETTQSGVTLSAPGVDPTYAQGTKTGAMLLTDTGTVAGVVDPSWSQTLVMVTGKNRVGNGGPAQQKDGLFIFSSVVSPLNGKVTVRQADDAPEVILPKPAVPYGTVSNMFPVGDRSTNLGALLSECIDETTGVPDKDSWNPGATVTASGQRLIMATNPGGISACFQQGQRTEFTAYLTKSFPDKPKLLPVAPDVGGQPLLAGAIPPGVQRMQLTLANSSTLDANVLGSTFAALLPAGLDDPRAITCTLYGSSEQILYTGPVAGS